MDICRKAEDRTLPFSEGTHLTGSERGLALTLLQPNSLQASHSFFVPASTPSDAVAKLRLFFQAIGARPCYEELNEHDILGSSHISSNSVDASADQNSLTETLRGLAGDQRHG